MDWRGKPAQLSPGSGGDEDTVGHDAYKPISRLTLSQV
jgi:hypothetical protein